MARMQRIVIPDQPLHIIQRGNNRSAVFFSDDDYHFYLDCLLLASDKYKCAIHAYVLMKNHVHLLITPSDEQGVSKLMQSVGRCYVRYINSNYHRTGTLWEGRYKSSLIDADRYLLACYRYIELNPVRASIVDKPVDYRWSSYRRNVGIETSQLIKPHQLYRVLGKTDEKRATTYHSMFQTSIDKSILTNIRDSINQNIVMGSKRFSEEVQSMLKRRVTKGQHGGDRRSEKFKELQSSSALTPLS